MMGKGPYIEMLLERPLQGRGVEPAITQASDPASRVGGLGWQNEPFRLKNVVFPRVQYALGLTE